MKHPFQSQHHKQPFWLRSLRPLAEAAGCNLAEYRSLDEDLHLDFEEDCFEVQAILRAKSSDLPVFLLDCASCATGDTVKLAVQANAPDSVVVGGFVLLPEEIGEEPDVAFMLRPLIPLGDRNRKVILIADLLKPHVVTISAFLKTAVPGVEVTSGIETNLQPDISYVAAAASASLPDGTLVDVQFEVAFSNLFDDFDGAPFCDGRLLAKRARSDDGGHLGARERLSFIEAGSALSRRPIQLGCIHSLFESGDAGTWVLEVDAPRAIAGLNVQGELLGLDLSQLRLDTLFN